MPRPRRQTRERAGYTQSHIGQLDTGFALRGAGFERGDIEAMREAWPILRGQVFALRAAKLKEEMTWGEDHFETLRRTCGHLRLRPLGWWLFESPEPRDGELSEAEQLRRMDDLTPEEVGMVKLARPRRFMRQSEAEREVFHRRHCSPAHPDGTCVHGYPSFKSMEPAKEVVIEVVEL